jgi:hypothetical protein
VFDLVFPSVVPVEEQLVLPKTRGSSQSVGEDVRSGPVSTLQLAVLADNGGRRLSATTAVNQSKMRGADDQENGRMGLEHWKVPWTLIGHNALGHCGMFCSKGTVTNNHPSIRFGARESRM